MCYDAKLLISTLQDFFLKHPLINPKTFLGDATFDSVTIYESLLSGDTFMPFQSFHSFKKKNEIMPFTAISMDLEVK